MKIEVEIRENKMFFRYTIGESSQSAEMGLTPDTLLAFTTMLKLANDSYWYDEKRKEELLRKIARILELKGEL